MKTNPNDLIHSFAETREYNGNLTGLTKREYLAAMAMQGLCASDEAYKNLNYEEVASAAMKQADALIEELNKEAKDE